MLITFDQILSEPLEFKRLMESNEICFDIVQNVLGEKTLNSWDPWKPATLFVLSSPIALSGISGVSSHQSYHSRIDHSSTPGCTNFLTKKIQNLLLHTSIVIKIFEIEPDGTIILNTRFAGVSEPSIHGATRAFDFNNIKIGYIKIQEKVESNGKLTLRNWNETKITPGEMYTEQDIKNLYSAFENTIECEDLNGMWKEIIRQTRKLSRRSIIDQAQIKTSKYLNILDHSMWFSEKHKLKYNLLKNNCQTFVLIFSDFVKAGSTRYDTTYAKYMEEFFGKYDLEGHCCHSCYRALTLVQNTNINIVKNTNINIVQHIHVNLSNYLFIFMIILLYLYILLIFFIYSLPMYFYSLMTLVVDMPRIM